MRVRQATLADVPAIVAMSERFYGTTSYRQWADFCPDTVADLAANLTENHVMLVAEQDGAFVGGVTAEGDPLTTDAATTSGVDQ